MEESKVDRFTMENQHVNGAYFSEKHLKPQGIASLAIVLKVVQSDFLWDMPSS